MSREYKCMLCGLINDLLEDDDPAKVLCYGCGSTGRLAPVVHVSRPQSAKSNTE